MNDEERKLLRAQISQQIAQTMRIGAEIPKIMAESQKIQAETRYYPLIALGTIVVSALVATTVLVIKLAF